MGHSVARHLRLDLDAYDETIRRFIPDYEAMLEVTAREVARVRPASVVDLGAGTGALSAEILGHDGVGGVVLLDIDEGMLGQARARVEPFGDRAKLCRATFDDPLPSADAFAASLSLHHIPSLELKGALFRRVFDALPPGGIFVNADANMPVDEAEQARLFRGWADHMVSQGITEEAAWNHFDEWSEEDTYLPLEAEVDALEALGFSVNLLWSSGPIHVVSAAKRARRTPGR